MQQPLIESPHNDYPPAFEQIWVAHPRRGNTQGANDNKKAAYRQYQNRLRQGESPDEMLEGEKAYAAYCEAAGIIGTPFVMRCATFLGPDCHFLCDWEAPDQKTQPKSDDEWLQAGREIGLEPKPGENWYNYKQRVHDALK